MQIKSIEDKEEKQIKVLEEHGKQLVQYNNKKESSKHSEQKEMFRELANGKMDEIQDLIKEINFNNLSSTYKGNTAPKTFIGFTDPLGFNKNIKEGYVTQGKAKEEQK